MAVVQTQDIGIVRLNLLQGAGREAGRHESRALADQGCRKAQREQVPVLTGVEHIPTTRQLLGKPQGLVVEPGNADGALRPIGQHRIRRMGRQRTINDIHGVRGAARVRR